MAISSWEKVLRNMLEHMGFPNVIATTNGREAFEILKKQTLSISW